MNANSTFNHFIFPTAFGFTGIVYRAQPFFLVEIRLPLPDEKLIRIHGLRVQAAPPRVVEVAESICGYFMGKPADIPWDFLDLSGLTKLQQAVLSATAEIPFGETRSYQDIAHAVNRPRAARFAGNTLARNPFPILIPCHRVIRSDGTLGGFGGGFGGGGELKKKLIDHEAACAGLPSSG